MSEISLDSTIMRSSDQVSTDLGEEVVIMGLQSEEYFSLENVGARIWNMIQEPKTAKEILDAIVRDYAVEPERCERDLLAVLREMENEGLIEVVAARPPSSA
ncbi:PqqD family protein [Candidatus Sumerlaeota bacterium]|nr:PqqD family protein [Candidatus Sumerlaeota bacterium]